MNVCSLTELLLLGMLCNNPLTPIKVINRRVDLQSYLWFLFSLPSLT